MSQFNPQPPGQSMQKEKEINGAILTPELDLELVVAFCSVLALHNRKLLVDIPQV